jgi:hypothetical protein
MRPARTTSSFGALAATLAASVSAAQPPCGLVSNERQFFIDTAPFAHNFDGLLDTTLDGPKIYSLLDVGDGWIVAVDPVTGKEDPLPNFPENKDRFRAGTVLHVLDVGAGPEIFATARPVTDLTNNERVALRFDGGRWTQLGESFTTTGDFPTARAHLASMPIGAGTEPTLVCGGRFSEVGGAPARNLAAWDGRAWTELGGGADGWVTGFHTDIEPNVLYVTGDFDEVGGGVAAYGIAAWDGKRWSTLPLEPGSGVGDIVRFDGDLHVAGRLRWTEPPPPPNESTGGSDAPVVREASLARWDGERFHALRGSRFRCHQLTVVDGPHGPALLFSQLEQGSGIYDYAQLMRLDRLGVARVDVTSRVRDVHMGVEGPVEITPGRRVALVRGDIEGRRYQPSAHLAWSDGLDIFPLAESQHLGFIQDWFARPIPGGTVLTGLDSIGTVVEWDGLGWHKREMTNGLYGNARTRLRAVPFRGDIYTNDRSSDDEDPRNWIHRLRDRTWERVGAGLNSIVYDMAVHDDGEQDVLVAVGAFTDAGEGVPAVHAAAWDGAAWTPLGTQPFVWLSSPEPPHAVVSFDDGSGPAIYVGGGFRFNGETAVHGVARWNGSAWEPVGEGIVMYPDAELLAYHDGSRPLLLARGRTTDQPSDFSVSGLVAWDGLEWQDLGSRVYLGPAPQQLTFHRIRGEGFLIGHADNDQLTGAEHDGLWRWTGTNWSPLVPSGLADNIYGRYPYLHDDGQRITLATAYGREAFFTGPGGPAPTARLAVERVSLESVLERHTINAVVETSEPLELAWLKDGVPIGLDDPRYTGADTNTLTILETRPEDSGRYRLLATGRCAVATCSDAHREFVLRGDLNGDGRCDTRDFGLFAGAFSFGSPIGDLNRDAAVDVFDFGVFVLDFGKDLTSP